MKNAPTTAGELIYAIGDIHGRYDLLKDLLSRIAADYVGRCEGRRPVLVFCGDYIDRGPNSAEVVEAVIWLQKRTDLEVRALKGNHEQALLAFIDDPDAGWPWLQFGGAETLESYGVAAPEEGERDYRRACDDLLGRIPQSHLDFLRRLELIVTSGDYAFVHAGVRPGRPLKRQVENDLLWIRADFLGAKRPFEKMIVHGHTWVDEQPQITDSRIGIDTGAYATGVLTALRLDGAEREFIQVGAVAG